MYRHQKHVLEQLTQDEDTKRVRQIRPGEVAQSVYDVSTGPTARYAIQRNGSGEMRTIDPTETLKDEVDASPYALYNEADVAEDEVLFGGGRDQGLFTPIRSPMVVIENSIMTQTMLQYGANLIDELDADEDEGDETAGKMKALMPAEEDNDSRHFMHSVPPIWRHAHLEISKKSGNHGRVREDMLDRLDFFAQRLEMSDHELQQLSGLELMERERSYGASHHGAVRRRLVFAFSLFTVPLPLDDTLEADQDLSNRLQRIFSSWRPRSWCSRQVRRIDEDHHRPTKCLVSQDC